MLFGHDEGKNLKQLCNGLKDVICIAMGGTGADNAEDARNNLGLGAAATEDIIPIAKGGTGADNAADALENLGGTSIVKLWENASPASAFAAQTIELDLNEYEEVKIIFRIHSSFNNHITTYTPKGLGGMADSANPNDSRPDMTFIRRYTVSSDGIHFLNGSAENLNHSAGEASSIVLIPFRIYGIKGVK